MGVPTRLIWVGVAIAVGVGYGLWRAARLIESWRRVIAARRRARIALHGQRDAAGVLTAHGYEIIAGQTRHQLVYQVERNAYVATLQCDYVVRRDGELWIAEVKTGRAAPQLSTAATRRQLLEYQVAFGVPGIVLVDMEQGTCAEVRFAARQLPLELG